MLNSNILFCKLVYLLAVRTSVDAQIELLMSKDPTDIFLGGNQLLRQVECLAHYHTYASQSWEPSHEYKALESKNQMKAIEMSSNSST